jgi:hypothetical protein
MFWDLKGAAFNPWLESERQMAATIVLLPEWDVVPRTTINLLKDILPLEEHFSGADIFVSREYFKANLGQMFYTHKIMIYYNLQEWGTIFLHLMIISKNQYYDYL